MPSEEGAGNRENGISTIDSADFNELIRGGRPTSEELAEKDSERASSSSDESEKEPEIQFESDSEEVSSTGGRGSSAREERASSGETPEELRRALSAIDRLTDEVRELKQPRSVRQAEPQIEWAEITPGLSLPKDQKNWPIQLTPEMLDAVGIDGGITKGLNVLANAFFYHITGAVSQSIPQVIENTQAERERGSAHRRAFFGAFPDLVGAEDIVERTEAISRQQGLHNKGLSDSQYAAEVATRARTRIANLRRMPLNDYMKEVETNARRAGSGESAGGDYVPRALRQGNSRARFGGSSSRVPPTPKMNANDAELQDMFSNRR